MPQPISVLVVDDSAFMRKVLVRRIESDPRFRIIDTAADGREAVEKTIRLKPDVVTLDVEMPVLDGIEALRQIVAKTSTPVIMVSAVTESGAKTTLDALAIGAVDFIPKSKGAELIHEKLLAAASTKKRAPAMALVSPASARPPAFAPPPSAAQHRAPFATARFAPKVVIIGSSTGGPQALQKIIAQLPERMPVPIFVAQHMPQAFTAALARRLNDLCPPKVVEAKDGEEPVAGTVYIAPGGVHMRIAKNGLKISPDNGESIFRPSVDVLARSALETYGKAVLAVMLTGLGNDGTREFVQLRKAGALTIAQDQESSAVFGMPKSLIEAGGAEEVLPLEQIGPRIRELLARAQ